MFYAQRDREREREEGEEKDTHCLENEVCGHDVVSPNQHYPDESHTRRLNREKNLFMLSTWKATKKQF